MSKKLPGLVLLFGFVASAVFASTALAATNLIPNGNLESSTGWNPVAGSGNSTSFSYPVVGNDGGKAAHIQVSAYSSGDVYWQPSNAPVTAGQKYTFSGYSKSNVSVVVIATYVNSNNTAFAWSTLGTVSGNNSWQQFTSTITPPTGATKVRIQHVIRAKGTLDIDNYNLVAGTATTTPPPPPATTTKPVISSFSANPVTIVMGSSTVLSWSVTGASSTVIDQGVGVVTGSSKTVSPTATTTYTLSAANPAGTTTAQVTVNVKPAFVPTPPPAQKPTISSFTANPTNIFVGSSTVLSWTVTGASTTIIDQGVGVVTGSSKTVSPSATTTYTLSAANPAGTTTAQVTVTVKPQPVPPPPPPSNGPNLVTNGDFELGTANNPTNWAGSSWGTNNAAFTYPVAGHNSARAAQVKITQFTDGAANWAFTHLPTNNHDRYQFSEDYMATVATEIDIEFLMSDGTYQYSWLQTVPTSASWKTITAQVTPPPGAVSFTVLHILAKAGTLTIDNASVSALSDQFSQGMLTISFDDNLLSQYQNGRPIMNAAGLKGTYFVITQDPGNDDAAMSWANLTTLKNEGNEIGGHTRTHDFLTQQTAAQQQSEILGSFQDLVAQGFSPKTFCYPYGDVNASVETQVKNAGYSSARGSYYGPNGTTSDHYDLYDIRVDQTSTLANLQKQIDQAKADKRWLILELHDIKTGGDEYSITPAFFQSLVTYIKNSGIQVVTVQQGAAQLNP